MVGMGVVKRNGDMVVTGGVRAKETMLGWLCRQIQDVIIVKAMDILRTTVRKRERADKGKGKAKGDKGKGRGKTGGWSGNVAVWEKGKNKGQGKTDVAKGGGKGKGYQGTCW